MEEIIQSFGLNASVLLSLTLVFFLFSENIARHPGKPIACGGKCREVAYGCLLAIIGVLVMATPVDFGNGVVFDARTILIGLAAAFFGWLPALIAMVACVAFRIYEGGAGMAPGILTILTALSCGLIWRRWRGEGLSKTRFLELYGLGLIIHIFSIAILFALLPATRVAILEQIAPVFLLLYPLFFAALGLLMQHRYRREIDGQQQLYSIIADQSESKRLLAALRASEAQAR